MAVINMETIEGLSKPLNICRHVLPEPRFAFIGLEPSEVAIAKKKPVIQLSVSFLSNNTVTLAYSSVEFPEIWSMIGHSMWLTVTVARSCFAAYTGCTCASGDNANKSVLRPVPNEDTSRVAPIEEVLCVQKRE